MKSAKQFTKMDSHRHRRALTIQTVVKGQNLQMPWWIRLIMGGSISEVKNRIIPSTLLSSLTQVEQPLKILRARSMPWVVRIATYKYKIISWIMTGLLRSRWWIRRRSKSHLSCCHLNVVNTVFRRKETLRRWEVLQCQRESKAHCSHRCRCKKRRWQAEVAWSATSLQCPNDRRNWEANLSTSTQRVYRCRSVWKRRNRSGLSTSRHL